MISLEGEPRKRAKQLTRKVAASPVLPLLGITKAVETVIVGGPTTRWLAYAAIVTLVWVFAEDLQRRAEDATETVQDAVDGEEA
jgi:hypothetical protein